MNMVQAIQYGSSSLTSARVSASVRLSKFDAVGPDVGREYKRGWSGLNERCQSQMVRCDLRWDLGF